MTPAEVKAKLEQFRERYGPAAGEHGAVLFVTELFGATPDHWQEHEVLRPYGRGERRIAIQACHNPGKSAAMSWCAWHQLLCRIPQKTAVTAPTNAQMYDVFFAEFKKWGIKLPPWLQALVEIKADRVELIPAPSESFMTLKTAKSDQPEALSGIHREDGWVLILVDEGSAVPANVMENASGSMSGARVTTIIASNPVRTSGYFYNAMRPESNWRKLRITGDPADDLGPHTYYSPRVQASYIEDIISDYGRESNQYRVRIQGLFPTSTHDTIIPFEWIQDAFTREVHVNPYAPVVWGLDCGLADLSTLAKRRGNKLLEAITAWSGLKEVMEIVGHVMAVWNMTPPEDRPVAINVDAIGLGAGVASRLRELGLPAYSINVSESPSLSSQYKNQRTELYFLARDWFGKRDCWMPVDKKLEVELTAQKYKPLDSAGLVIAIPKREMVKHIHPQRSPDRGEAFILTFAGNAMIASGAARSTDWNKPLHRGIKGIV